MEISEKHALSKIVVFCFLIKDNKILLIKRLQEPFKNTVTIPGGHKEYSETLQAACTREMLEETGYSVDNLKFAGIMHTPRSYENKPEYTSVYYTSSDFRGNLQNSAEGSLTWTDLSQITPENISAEHIYHPALLALLPKVLKGEYPFEASMKHLSGDSFSYTIY